jgi:hypothetical protein
VAARPGPERVVRNIVIGRQPATTPGGNEQAEIPSKGASGRNGDGPHKIGIAITICPLDCPTEGPSAKRQVRADLPELSPPRPRPIIP